MNHPYELLADLVDGTLDEGDLAGVQAHLDVCATCREDVAHATAGREAARSLPQATPPPDLHQRIVAAAVGGHGAPGWYRWAGVAAAAAVVVAIAIALPNVGTDDRNLGAEDVSAPVSAAETDTGSGSSGVAVEVQDRDYDPQDLERLAADAGLRAGAATTTEGTGSDSVAVRCVRRATKNNATGQLTRLIEARFEGRAAYIAVFLEDPGADQQPDLVAVWAAARDDCSFLSSAFSRL